ncbi:hypothetical protein [Ruegeria lacuscaerulensis]|uniref:hypothetical protein n=1 Tax=Ruegeria lacuscaerulensis TaxID=55218 RepID=UPI001480E68E|nr:hypothetical protein [Ruegeria lacuscaerulensis]
MRERSRRSQRLYAAIPNAALRDEDISIEARGLLALLMTYSDDWEFNKTHLRNVTGMGRDKFEKAMGELRAVGYVVLVQNRLENGQLVGSTWVIRDDRTPENPGVGTEALKNRGPEKPSPGESAHIRITNTKKTKIQESPIPPEGADDLFSADAKTVEKADTSDSVDEGFKEFWGEIWPSHKRKAGKADCKKVYLSACLGKHKKADLIAPEELNRCARAYIASVRDLEYLKAPLAWLRQPGWEPFMRSGQDQQQFNHSDLSAQQEIMLRDGRCPPSMMEDGQPNAMAQFFLKKFGGRAA